MSKTTIVQDVLDVFRAAGFEVRVSEFGNKPETIIYGTSDNAGILMESVCEHFGSSTEAAFSCAQRENKEGDAPLTAPAPLTDEPQLRKATTELSLPELAEEFRAVAALGCDYTISAGVCAKLYDAMTTPPAEAAPAPKQSELSSFFVAMLDTFAKRPDAVNKQALLNQIMWAIEDAAEDAAKAAPAAPVQTAVPVPRATLLMIYEAMNHMGDILNNMDACEDEDEEATTPAFDAIRELLDDSYVAAPVQAVWLPMMTAPKDGTEILLRYPLQGNIKQLACWNTVHGYWHSKGRVIFPDQQKCEWSALPSDEHASGASAGILLMQAEQAQAEPSAANVLDTLWQRVTDAREAAYTFGDTCKEAVEIALDGVLDMLVQADLALPAQAEQAEGQKGGAA